MREPANPDRYPALDESPARGRRRLTTYTLLVITISAVTITAYVVYIGPGKLPQQVVRFALTIGLMYWLWRGSTAARWVTIVLLGSGGVLASLIMMSDRAPMVFRVVHALMTATYVPFAAELVLPTAVREAQRRLR